VGEHIAAGDPSERSEHDGGPRSAALSERVMARVAEDWRCFHAQSAAVEIALIFWLIWMRLVFQLPPRCPRVTERCSRPHFCLKDGVRRCCSALLRGEGRKLTYPLTRGRKV
jgi:hypothetical protein